MNVTILCGLFSANLCFAPLAAELEKDGHHVEVRSHYAMPAKTDIVIGHSAGCDRALEWTAKLTIAVDCTVANGGANTRGRTIAFYNPANRAALKVCCGGAVVRGAEANIVWPVSHLGMLTAPKLRARIVALVNAVK